MRLRLASLAAVLVGLGVAAGVVGVSRSRSDQASPARARVHYVAASGSDGGGCGSVRAPCATLNAAYRAAAPGDIVNVEPGTYPPQTIGADASKTGGPDVVFRPAPHAAVTLSDVEIHGSFVELRRMRVHDLTIREPDVDNPPPVTNVTIDRVSGRNFNIFDASHVTLHGGSWGPVSDCGGPFGGSSNSIRQLTPDPPTDIVIDHVTIHDVQSEDLNNCHIEGLAIFAGTNVRVSGSRFYGNSVYDIFLQANSGPISGLTIAGNWLAAPVGTDGKPNGTVIGFSDVSSNVALQNNRFNAIVSLDDNGDNPVYSNFVVAGNVGILPYNGCSLRGISWMGNTWQNGACSATDRSLNGAALPYRNRANGRALDYTIVRHRRRGRRRR